jgi:hypothetical protein
MPVLLTLGPVTASFRRRDVVGDVASNVFAPSLDLRHSPCSNNGDELSHCPLAMGDRDPVGIVTVDDIAQGRCRSDTRTATWHDRGVPLAQR